MQRFKALFKSTEIVILFLFLRLQILMFKVWLISRVKPLATFTILDGLFPKQVIHTDIKLNLTRMPLILVMSNGAQPCKIYIFNLFFLIKNNGNLGRAAELKIFFKC